jgi:hypothetical protein
VILVVNHVDIRLGLAPLGCLDYHEHPLLQILVDSILFVALVLLLSSMIFLGFLFGECCGCDLRACINSWVFGAQ